MHTCMYMYITYACMYTLHMRIYVTYVRMFTYERMYIFVCIYAHIYCMYVCMFVYMLFAHMLHWEYNNYLNFWSIFPVVQLLLHRAVLFVSISSVIHGVVIRSAAFKNFANNDVVWLMWPVRLDTNWPGPAAWTRRDTMTGRRLICIPHALES